MATKEEDYTKRQLNVFVLPPLLLASLRPRSATVPPQQASAAPQTTAPTASGKLLNTTNALTSSNDPTQHSTSCALCGTAATTLAEQRSHLRSDWHTYNLKQKLQGRPTVDESAFEALVGQLEESLSGSANSSDDADDDRHGGGVLAGLLRRQAQLHTDPDDTTESSKQSPGSPFAFFTSPLLPPKHALAIYKSLFTTSELAEQNLATVLHAKQLAVLPAATSSATKSPALPPSTPTMFICLIGGGHFAAAVIACSPIAARTPAGHLSLQPLVLAHQTFHRYTTRRKQGGSQASNDAAKGAAHSAGAAIRRYNEAALEAEVRALLESWRQAIDGAALWFVRATGAANRRAVFGGEGVLKAGDARARGIPFATRRATGAEVRRVWAELTRPKVIELVEKEEKPEKKMTIEKKADIVKSAEEEEEEAQILHTSQIQALIRRSRAPALLAYLTAHQLSPDFSFQPASSPIHHHSPTPLHLAASSNAAAIITALLTKAAADPTIPNADGRTAFELAGDRATRDAFRLARHQLGDTRWDWTRAAVPAPLTKDDADARAEAERRDEAQRLQQQREEGLQRLRVEQDAAPLEPAKAAKVVLGGDLSAEERREKEARGLTPQMRMKLERERRARAAEERMRRTAGGA